jgi:integrase
MKGHLKEYKPGTWHAYVDLPRGEDGKRKLKCVTIKASGIRDAQRQLNRLLAEANAGNIAPPSKETVETYLTRWLAKRKADGLSPKTMETWGDFARAYIIPRLGRVALEKLTPTQVEEFYTYLRTSGRRRGEGGLAPRTVLHVHRLLSEVMKSAVHRQLITRNPCEPVAPSAGRCAKRPVLDPEGVQRLLTAAGGTWLHLPILLAAGMGLRRGEILGLRWQDIDFKTGTLSVDQTVQHVRGKGLLFKAPKTENSQRTITMPEFVAVELRKLKARQAEHRLQMGPDWIEPGLVFRNDDDGRARSPQTLTRGFARLLKQAGSPDMHFHDLRHTNATLLLLAKVDTKIVSARLGHCNTAITRDLYQHVMPQMDADAAERTDAIFRAAGAG